MNRVRLPLLLLIMLIFSLTSCKSYIERVASETGNSYELRVKLQLGNEVTVRLDEHIAVQDFITGEHYSFSPETNSLIIKSDEGVTTINGKVFQAPLKIYSRKERLIKVGQKEYFGFIKIYPDTLNLEVINYIPIETYLISVLPSEVPLYFNYEALKAQAVVARTYSYYFMERYGAVRNYDVDNTTSYQVYNGFSLFVKNRDIKKVIDAIKETESRIITYENSPIIAYFHANSGGLTRSGLDYFGPSSDFPYLTAKTDPYSTGYRGSSWDYTIERDLLFNKLGIEVINDVVTDENGFVKSIFSGEREIDARTMRRRIGYALIKSERFIFSDDGNYIRFEGIGYGHGVGMSQWGAQGMADGGYSYEEIINFYYPGTAIEIF